MVHLCLKQPTKLFILKLQLGKRERRTHESNFYRIETTFMFTLAEVLLGDSTAGSLPEQSLQWINF